MKILITGGTGFIGSRLALKCLERGDQVVVLGQENTDAEKQNKKLIEDKGAKVVFGSVTDKTLMAEVTKGIDLVFHLAAAQHEANIPDQVFHDVNVSGTRNLLEASIEAGVRRFVHGSTIGVYGDPKEPVSESSFCEPVNIYGKTKLEGEQLVLSYQNRIPLVVIRIPETYGPGDHRLLKLFRAIQKKRFFKIGPGKNLHHLIYIDDLISGMLNAAENEKALGEICLLAGSKPVTTDEMCETIADALDSHLPGFRAPLFPFTFAAVILETLLRPLGIQPPLHRRRMDFFIKSFSLSNAKTNALLNFDPQHSFEMGIAETARWYKESGLLNSGGSYEEHSVPAGLKVDTDLTAQIEPFDTFWEAPKDIEKGYAKFDQFYKHNYLKYIPDDKSSRILVISCGTGYMVNTLNKAGYGNVLGIDSDKQKVDYALSKGLNCRHVNAFAFLRENGQPFDMIFAEQEINHLTKDEIRTFLALCHENLNNEGTLFVHSLNGANPITGSEALAQNFDHYNTFTSYSLGQILFHANFRNIRIFPLKLYIFYDNPANYIGIALTFVVETIFRMGFIFYGKDNKNFSKKIGAVCKK